LAAAVVHSCWSDLAHAGPDDAISNAKSSGKQRVLCAVGMSSSRR
jgi:hypothetical protein